MAGWQAKKLQLPNHNFETTAVQYGDGRKGLCYHGSTIWQHEGSGWEGFIESDWNAVWEKGKPCSFHELPPDMRIACPVCGAKIQPEDAECSQCGIIFDKMKDEPAEAQPTDIEEDTRKTPRSKLIDFSLAIVVVLIAGFFIYNTFKPKPPQSSSNQGTPVNMQPDRSAQTTGQPDPYQYDDTSGYDQEDASPETGEAALEAEAIEDVDYFSHIDLDDPETAHNQLQEEADELNKEAMRIQEALNNASTTEEKRQARQDKYRYDQKFLQLSQLIKEFNARNQNK